MAAVNYKLTPEILGTYFIQNNQFSFKCAYGKNNDSNDIVTARQAPKITINIGDVVSTTNIRAQHFLEMFRVPQGIRVNGATPPAGPVFQTTSDPATVDLDPYFV